MNIFRNFSLKFIREFSIYVRKSTLQIQYSLILDSCPIVSNDKRVENPLTAERTNNVTIWKHRLAIDNPMLTPPDNTYNPIHSIFLSIYTNIYYTYSVAWLTILRMPKMLEMLTPIRIWIKRGRELWIWIYDTMRFRFEISTKMKL